MLYSIAYINTFCHCFRSIY
uniref:Uncharacterized protein n=1 Tax=Anguilla anguilla TaxID=7936 RepID=A0A0E9U3Q7_ANGAN